MACERFDGALKARALGAPLDAAAAAHLAVCARCQAALGREERLNAAIDAALVDVGAAAPAPEFTARLREHVEHAPRATAFAWWKPAAALACAAVVAVVASNFGRATAPSAPPIVASDSSRTTPARGPAEAGRHIQEKEAVASSPIVASPAIVAAPAIVASDFSRTTPPRARAIVASDFSRTSVLVPRDQRAAVGRLFDSLRAGRPEVVSVLMNLPNAGTAQPPPAVTIAPIRIDPLVVPTIDR